jgi:hypothetical protein
MLSDHQLEDEPSGTNMNLLDCSAALQKNKTLPDLIQAAKKAERPTATKAERRAVLDALPGLLGGSDYKAAVAATLALVLLDADESIAKMRKEGMLRASRYGFNAGCLKKVVDATLSLATEVNASCARLEYLKSILALLELAGPAKQLKASIICRLQLRRSFGVKTLLAIVNYTFAVNWLGDRNKSSRSAQYWSATEFASAFSRLYTMFRNELGIQRNAFHCTDDLASSNHEAVYQSLLVDAASLNEFIDAEVMIDGLPYKAEITGGGVLVSAIDSEFERSVRLGYIQTDHQMAIRVHLSREVNDRRPIVASFNETVQAILGAGLLNSVTLKDSPMERLVFEIPFIPHLFETLGQDAAFIEEIPFLQGAHLDNFHPDGAGLLPVSETLTSMDLFKVQRIFNLIEMAFQAKLKSIEDEARQQLLRLRSTVMVIRSEELQLILEKILSPEKVAELMSLLSLTTDSSAEDSEVYVDLQYKPFLHAVSSPGRFIAVGPSVVARSNLVRSVRYASKIKRKTNAKDDPMQAAVVNALEEACFITKDSFEFNIDGRMHETDIFAYRDGVLFVFECKNAYHPCSPHEMRGSYDLLETSRKQLDIRAGWLSNSVNQARLFEAMGWTVPSASRVYTCTVTANRLFTGYKLGVHPVRQAHELINVLTVGQIGRGLDEPSLRFWRAEKFQIDDLIDYLNGKSVVGQHHAAMFPVTRSIDIMGKKLEFAQFAMNLEQASTSMAQAFDVVVEPGEEGEQASLAGEPHCE